MNDRLLDGKKPSNVGTIYGPGAVGRLPPRVGEPPEGPRDSLAYRAWKAADDEAEMAAKRYVPSPEGMLAARLYDNQAARLPWEPPSRDITDEDFARAERLLTIVVDAFSSGDHEVLGRLPAAIDVLDPPGSDCERLVRYANGIVNGAARLRENWQKNSVLANKYQWSAGSVEREVRSDVRLNHQWLVKWCDSAFEKLDPRDLFDALREVKLHRYDGHVVGERSGDRIAAELAIKVGAFGTDTDPDPGTENQLNRLLDRIRTYRKRVTVK